MNSKKLADARRLRASGLSFREIARQLGASHVTIRKWLARDAEAPLPAHMAPPAPAPALAEGDAIPLDASLDFVRRSMRESHGIAQEARAVGNYAAAQRASRDVAMLSAIVARLERDKKTAGDGVTVSAAEITAAREKVDGLFDALKSRPLLCADCGRKLSIAWGDGPEETAP